MASATAASVVPSPGDELGDEPSLQKRFSEVSDASLQAQIDAARRAIEEHTREIARIECELKRRRVRKWVTGFAPGFSEAVPSEYAGAMAESPDLVPFLESWRVEYLDNGIRFDDTDGRAPRFDLKTNEWVDQDMRATLLFRRHGKEYSIMWRKPDYCWEKESWNVDGDPLGLQPSDAAMVALQADPFFRFAYKVAAAAFEDGITDFPEDSGTYHLDWFYERVAGFQFLF